MLKMTRLPNESEPKVKNCEGEFVKFNVDNGGNVEIAKKSRKSKGQNLFKSGKLAKSGKKSSKNRNFLNFDIKKNGPNFLTPKATTVFNCLQLF